MLFEPDSELHVSVDMPLICAMSQGHGSKQLQKISEDLIPYSPLEGRTLQPGSIPVLIYVPLLTTGSCAERVAGWL